MLRAEERPHRIDASCHDPAVIAATGYGRSHPSVYRHLVMAAEEIAGRDAPASGSSRFAVAAARFRDMAYGPGREQRGPVVRVSAGLDVPLPALMDAVWRTKRGSFPDQLVDAEMIDTARRLLLDLKWELPPN